MATYAAYRHVELDNVGYGKKRVLKPPGGGSSDIFGSGEETSPRRVKNHNSSQLGSALYGDSGSSTGSTSPETPRANKPDRNPVTGITPDQQNNSSSHNGSSSSSINGDSKSTTDSSPSSTKPRTRVPPGGYSSGLW